MKKEKIGVHLRHCCKKHGCKYGDDDCPVAFGDYEPEQDLCQYCVEAIWDEPKEENATYEELVELVKNMTNKLIENELAIQALLQSFKVRDPSIEERYKVNLSRLIKEFKFKNKIK